MYCYYPKTIIDFRWEFLPTVEETIVKIASKLGDGFHTNELECLLHCFKKAKNLAKKIGWDEHITHGMYVLYFPVNDGFEYGFAWKQNGKSGNGSTFIISPIELPYNMEELADFIEE